MIEPHEISLRALLKGLAASPLLLSLGGLPGFAWAEESKKVVGRQRLEVRPHLGRTASFVDGAPVPGMSCYGHGSERVGNDMMDLGMPVFFVSAGSHWKGPDNYDFSPFRERVKRLGEKTILATSTQATARPRLQNTEWLEPELRRARRAGSTA